MNENNSLSKKRKSITEMDLIDDFLFGESLMNKETAVPMAKMIIERATGIKVKNLKIECQKTINGLDTEYHGIRLDVSANEMDIVEKNAETVRLYDIEPNNSSGDNLPKRNRYYQALLDVKLLEAGADYDKLPELWSIWILPYDPFGKNCLIYTVKNIVEEMPEIEYNDGVKKIFLYTDGEAGGNQSLKNLLRYIRNTCGENAVDPELKKLHSGIERLRNSREIGVRYMLEQEKMKEKLRHMVDEVEKEVTERVTEEVTERVTEEVTERVTSAANERGIKALVETCQEFGASREDAVSRIVEKFGVSAEAAENYIGSYWGV